MQYELEYTCKNKLHSEIIKVCHKLELPLHFNKFGSKVFTNYQRVALIILFHRSKKSLRDFVAELYESYWPKWLSLKEIPGKSTLNDWMNLFVLETVRRLNQLLLKEEKPEVMAIDSTGFDSWQRSRHYEKRILADNMPYAKTDIFIDTKKMLVHDFVLRTKPRHDVLGAKTMMKRNKHCGVKILGDGAYDAEELHELANKKGNNFFAPIRKSSRKKPKGFFRRKCVEEDKDYPKRSRVESVIHSLKTLRQTLKNKKPNMKKKEFAWTILTYNIKKIIKNIIKLITNIIPDISKNSLNLYRQQKLKL